MHSLIELESRPNQIQSSKRNPLRSSARNRTSLVTKKFTRVATETTTPILLPSTTVLKTTSTTSIKPRTTRVVRKRVSHPINRRVLSTTESVLTTLQPYSQTTLSIPMTTFSPIYEIPSSSSNEGIDDDVASILPALTSVRPRKTSIVFNDTSINEVHKDSILSNQIETSSTLPAPQNSFDEILEHQYKIKGLDKDYEDEKVEEDEKLIGVLGSQVKVVLHSVSSDMDKTKIECLEYGNYPHPLSCNMYISCAKVRGFLEGFIFKCGDGMSFDPIRGVCDWSIKIGCTRNNVKILTS